MKSKTARTFELLAQGWVTALESAMQGGCLALSQRVTEYERRGGRVHRMWVQTKGGARVMAYRIGKARA
jgi:Helix-turn-helix domain